MKMESNYNTPACTHLSQNQMGLSTLHAAEVLSQGTDDDTEDLARLDCRVTILKGIIGSVIKYLVVSIPAIGGRMTEHLFI